MYCTCTLYITCVHRYMYMYTLYYISTPLYVHVQFILHNYIPYMYKDIALYLYNTLEIIGRGHSPRQLSQGCYMPITASKQGYMYFIPW